MVLFYLQLFREVRIMKVLDHPNIGKHLAMTINLFDNTLMQRIVVMVIPYEKARDSRRLLVLTGFRRFAFAVVSTRIYKSIKNHSQSRMVKIILLKSWQYFCGNILNEKKNLKLKIGPSLNPVK